MTGTSHEDLFTLLTVSRRILLRTTNISDKLVEKIKTHILDSITFFFFENRAFCEMKWKKYSRTWRATRQYNISGDTFPLCSSGPIYCICMLVFVS
jgi:hypothetical protein